MYTYIYVCDTMYCKEFCSTNSIQTKQLNLEESAVCGKKKRQINLESIFFRYGKREHPKKGKKLLQELLNPFNLL